MPLPSLREELAVLPGAVLSDGQPSWTLHDPTRNRFFTIDWPTFEILQRWSFDDAYAIADAVSASTTLQLDANDVEQITQFLRENQLLQPQSDSAQQFSARLQRQRGGPVSWLLHHYLFFRVPLLRPDAWLTRWQNAAALFYTRGFLWLTLLAFALGFTQVARQWDSFTAALVDTFTWSGLAAYGVAIAVVKCLHELGHAFTAKRHGCRIPTMGVAFLVMWPMAYTDTNETWRLTNRWARLQVAAAGIATELVIAAWSTLAWALLPDGEMRTACFVLATTSWVTTLAINASPFMRFDGYFILSDWLNLPNLHERSFALARWKLREWLFGLNEPCPEYFSSARRRFLVVFAWVTGLYRVTVFIGIALLVYHQFFKLLGIGLFAVEIAWFILLPVRRELQAWKRRWSAIRASRRARLSALAAVGLLLLAALPWPTRTTASGVLRPVEQWPIHAPAGTQIKHFSWHEGDAVPRGAALIELGNPELKARHDAVAARVERLRWQTATAGFDAQGLARLQSNREELATAEAELAGIDKESEKYRPHAPFAGELRDIDPDLKAGQWLTTHERIAVLVGRDGALVETWLDEESIKRIALGDNGIFIADSGAGTVLPLTVSYIDADASRVLPNGLLAAQAGGHVLTRDRDRQLIPEHAIYRVTLSVDTGDLPTQSLRGKVVIRSRWQAPAQRYLRNALAVLLRESSF